MAAPHEIRMLMDKEGNEAKAKRACQQKVYQLHLDTEILEAEFQWSVGCSLTHAAVSQSSVGSRCRGWQKLIVYCFADHYVNFKDLVNDLYKVCLWMSVVSPASFSTNAINRWWLSTRCHRHALAAWPGLRQFLHHWSCLPCLLKHRPCSVP